jgi:hypothetical protein
LVVVFANFQQLEAKGTILVASGISSSKSAASTCLLPSKTTLVWQEHAGGNREKNVPQKLNVYVVFVFRPLESTHLPTDVRTVEVDLLLLYIHT